MSQTDESPSRTRSPSGAACAASLADTADVLRRARRRAGTERAIVLAALGALTVLCWASLALPFERLNLELPVSPKALEYALLWGQWNAAMLAILLPAQVRTTLLYLRAARYRYRVRWPYLATMLFVCGLAFALATFAVVAAVVQRLLADAGVLDRNHAIANSTVVALMLVSAGVYQWTPPKLASLEHFHAPLPFVLAGWRPGAGGALRMGLEDGVAAVRSYWLLAALLLATGPLHLLGVAAISTLALAEKLLRGGIIIACVAGLALVAWGSLILFP
ncbi:copper chaperone [Massilia horti]|uniref:DUF2182 domain-containing protein n=1 Tax=Massilia horti TaxID=2562153 RepID=A0A4Y9T7K7_9BURK|nr:DUF2182 domain-containing protein [Massilia horti]TFW33427.1 DUF2182 domain-containing protein [Massilia horti]